jgi:hypothetical protein
VDRSIRSLVRGHWYDAVAAVLADRGSDDLRLQHAARLAVAAKRILDLDAEDFGVIGGEFDSPWARRLEEASFPATPKEPQRGALGSLVGLYELMLEVLELRAQRHEPLQVVVTAHLIGEYLPLLAWEPRLGHGGDPLQMRASVGERWGTASSDCAHSSAARATARRALNACDGDVVGYTAYLDKFHSRLGNALAVCAMNHETVAAGERPDVGETCPRPCSWTLQGSLEERRDIDARVRLALLYQDSAIVSLRHHAPVGHFFGVPSTAEIGEAWVATWERLTAPWPDGSNPLTAPGAVDRGEAAEALPGMSRLVSAVAGRPIGPGHLIRTIGGQITDEIDAATPVGRG